MPFAIVKANFSLGKYRLFSILRIDDISLRKSRTFPREKGCIMAPKKQIDDDRILETCGSTPRFGSAFCLPLHDNRWLGVDYHRRNRLVVADPKVRSLRQYSTPHVKPITAVSVLKLGNGQDEYIATGDERGYIYLQQIREDLHNDPIMTAAMLHPQSQEIVPWDWNAPVKQIVEGPDQSCLITLHAYRHDGSLLVVWNWKQSRFEKVIRTAELSLPPVIAVSTRGNSYFQLRKASFACTGTSSPVLETYSLSCPSSWVRISASSWLRVDPEQRCQPGFIAWPTNTWLLLPGGAETNGITCWSTDTGKPNWHSGFIGAINAHEPLVQICSSPDRCWIATVDHCRDINPEGGRSHLTLLSSQDGSVKARIAVKHGQIGAAAFSLDSKQLAFTHPEKGVVPVSLDFLLRKGSSSLDECLFLPAK